MNQACVLVLGDLGRSPRMLNHTKELLRKMDRVHLMGYCDSTIRDDIASHANVNIIDLKSPKIQRLRRLSSIIYTIVKVLWQLFVIIFYLSRLNLRLVLIQNPPCIPTFAAVWLIGLFKRFQLWIDFHNYGYTILALSVRNSLILKMAQHYEMFFGRKAIRAFCVSKAMKDDLLRRWGIQALTLYDRPAHPLPSTNESQLLEKYGIPKREPGELFIVSSTSWTKDEDFSILLEALTSYEKSSNKSRIRAFITGKGPQKEFYEREIAQLKPFWTKIDVRTVWLEPEDYLPLLSQCDFGVCLHYSSSGLDLPMKVVDMFTVGLPVLAIDYQALGELVLHGKNGYIFSNSTELTLLIDKITSEPNTLKSLQNSMSKYRQANWTDHWNEVVAPLLPLS